MRNRFLLLLLLAFLSFGSIAHAGMTRYRHRTTTRVHRRARVKVKKHRRVAARHRVRRSRGTYPRYGQY